MPVRAAKGNAQTEGAAHCQADAAKALDDAVKDLIDGLIVPKLVEEFIRLHGSAPAAAERSRPTEESHVFLPIQS